MTMIRPETEMKDSGYVWLKQIPKHWTTAKLLYVLRSKISDGPHETPNYVDKGIPFISLDSLNDGKTIDFTGCKRFITEDDYERYSLKTTLEKGDILFSKAASIGKTAIVGDEKFMVWSPLAIIKNNSSIIDNTFLYHLLNCSELIMSITLSGSMNTQINVGMREMEQARIPLPPLSEQQAIADYLDETCSKIDAIIAEAKTSIEEYKELKQAVIFEAVTKGLDKNVAMKDSGVEWIGTIPASWNLRMLNQYVGQVKCKNADLVETNLLSLSYGKIKRKNINSNDGLLPESFDGYNIVEANDIVLRLTDLQNDHKSLRVGLVTERGIITSAYVTLRPIGINPAYLALVLHAFDYKKGFYGMGSGIRQGLTYDGVKSLKIVVPSDAEQTEIVDYVNEMTEKCDELSHEQEELVSDLEAYKKSLIYEVVTGKRRVV